MTSMTSKLKLIAMLGLAAGLAVVGSTCGGVTDSRESARDKATKATCDRVPDLRSDRARRGRHLRDLRFLQHRRGRPTGNSAWPVATCGSINQMGLGVCLSAIDATDCTSIIDFLATLAKCEDVDVCIAPSHPDGG